MRSDRFNDALNRLAAQEDQFLQAEFLTPCLSGGEVRVRIAGVVCRLRIEPADFTGWGVFQPTSHASARLVRTAGLAERRRYLDLFPLVRLILCRQEEQRWLAIPAHRGDSRFRIEGMVPVQFVEDAGLFEVVLVRFDGMHFWFEDLEPSRDPGTAAYLRKSLHRAQVPDSLRRPGLTPEERTAYAANYVLTEKARRRRESDVTEEKLRRALEHAGAELVGYLQRPDSYRVTFRVGGQTHTSAVDKGDLSVQVAGICLSGQDEQFDLNSLVGVLRETGWQ